MRLFRGLIYDLINYFLEYTIGYDYQNKLFLGLIIFTCTVYSLCEVIFYCFKTLHQYTFNVSKWRNILITIGAMLMTLANASVIADANDFVNLLVLFSLLGGIAFLIAGAGEASIFVYGSMFLFGNSIFLFIVCFLFQIYWPPGFSNLILLILFLSGIAFLLWAWRLHAKELKSQ